MYPEGEEVDHEVLVHDLVERYPDGWALSTSSTSLQDVLALCPRGVRIGSWRRQFRPYLERPQSWEPVIFCGGRQTPEPVPDSLVARVPADWDLPGRKPDAFFEWVFAFLGVRPGDLVDEPFPGSGAGARVLEGYLAAARNVSA